MMRCVLLCMPDVLDVMRRALLCFEVLEVLEVPEVMRLCATLYAGGAGDAGRV